MSAKKRTKAKKQKAAARRARDRPERQQDARLVAARIMQTADDGARAGDWVVALSPARTDDGRVLMWHALQPVAFNLIESKRFRDRGARKRRAIMSQLRLRPNGDDYGPPNSHAAIDCVSDLQAAVLFAFTAIESLANHVIDMLDDDATITRKGNEVPKADMVRTLGIDDKLKKVMPLLDPCVSIAGTTTWTRYRHLKVLRDELLHVKERGNTSDPDDPSAYDRLMLGQGDVCTDDAIAVVEGVWPGFLPDHVRETLQLPQEPVVKR